VLFSTIISRSKNLNVEIYWWLLPTKISIYEIAKFIGQRELLVQAFSQSSSGDKSSTSQKVSGKSSSSLEFVVNVVTLEANTLCPPILLAFEIFNYNVHNCLVDSSASVNVML